MDTPAPHSAETSGRDQRASHPVARPGTVPSLPEGVRVVEEEVLHRDGLEVHVHAGWADRYPWLVQGTTGRGSPDDPLDLAFFGRGSGAGARRRWSRLAHALGMPRVVHGLQVHGPSVRLHRDGPPGLHLCEDTDGHATRSPGTLLTIATADCITIFLVDPRRRAVAALHGGWRGVAAGILERGMEVMAERLASKAADLLIHLGPAICGECYEVGPEVHDALGLEVPPQPTPVDLRAVVARRAVAAGVPARAVTVSAACTRCEGSRFFSHRGGDGGRQLGFVGIDPTRVATGAGA